MLLRVSRFFLASALTVLVVPVAAQVAATQPKQPCNCTQQKPHPYTAEFKTTRVQTLANGTTITHESTETMAQDSSGRYMSSITEEKPETEERQWTHGHAHDTAASTDANWDSRTKKATVTKYPPRDEQKGCWASESGHITVSFGGGQPAPGVVPPAARAQLQHPQTSSEDLGTTTIQGIEATGRRTTTTIPAGQMGNDQPIVSTYETWQSKGLGFGLVLRSVRDDPRTGTETREIVSLTQGEPDPALFQPPDGYEVKTDELHQVACQQ
jgi:hypothetical protein